MKSHALMTALAIAVALALGGLTPPAKAAPDAAHAHAHAHTPLHGGVVVEVRDMDYELVARAGLIQLYVRDHGKPVDLTGASARLTLLSGTVKQQVNLQPAGDRLEAAGSFQPGPGTQVVAVVTVKGKPATARFTLK